MQHLGEKWLKRLNAIYILYGVVMLCLFAYTAFDQKTILISPVPFLGVSVGTTMFVLCSLIYNVFLLRIVKRYNMWLAYVIGYALINVTNAVIVELALKSSSEYIFILITCILGILSVSLGPIISISIMAVSGILMGMEIAKTTQPTSLGVYSDVIIYIFRDIFTIIGLYLLRNKYVSTDLENKNYIENYFVNNKVVSLLTNSISDGVIIIDQTGIIHSVNPATLKLLNQKSEDILALSYKSVIKFKNVSDGAPDDTDDPIMNTLESKTSLNKELVLVSNGSEKYVDVAISAIVNPETKDIYGAVIILRDVSKKKSEENARSEFISTASHEMRTPIAAIEGYLELALNEKVSKVDANARKYLEKAKTSTQHLGRLFQDLLVSAKAEDGRLVNHPIVFEVGSLLEQQAEISRMVAQQKGLELDFVISSEENISKHGNTKQLKPFYYVLADPERIREIANNLIDNSMKYTTKGKITIGVTGNDEVVQFFIKDTGIGIDQEDIPHLFQKFYRVDSSDTRTTGGTGLGLFISKKMINLYNGRIWAESQKGQGTTFFVNLPRLNTLQAEATIAKQQNIPIPSILNNTNTGQS